MISPPYHCFLRFAELTFLSSNPLQVCCDILCFLPDGHRLSLLDVCFGHAEASASPRSSSLAVDLRIWCSRSSKLYHNLSWLPLSLPSQPWRLFQQSVVQQCD